MKRYNIIAVCLLLGVFALGLTGFTTVGAETGESAGEDRLIGVLLTREHLDLFDIESYLNDNLNSFGGGEITGDTSAYQGRIYATVVQETHTDEKGRTTTTPNYKFDTVEGIAYYAASISDGTNTYTATGGSEGISDAHTHISVTDAGESISLEGTVYVAATNRHITWFFNPVYQAADGSVYVMSGNGMSAEYYGEDASRTTHSTDAEYTVTENGETKTYGTSVDITVSALYPPERIRILQMDADNSVTESADYAPGETPETLTPNTNTAYIVVETYKTDLDGNEKITRELYGRDDEMLETFVCRDDGVCIKHATRLEWAQ